METIVLVFILISYQIIRSIIDWDVIDCSIMFSFDLNICFDTAVLNQEKLNDGQRISKHTLRSMKTFFLDTARHRNH